MMRPLILLSLVLAGGCSAGSSRVYNPVGVPSYQALGSEPFWSLAIGDRRIVLSSSLHEGELSWPRTLPQIAGETRRWESVAGTSRIIIEARPGPCETEGEEIFEDHVVVRTGELELTGCGGRLLRREGR